MMRCKYGYLIPSNMFAKRSSGLYGRIPGERFPGSTDGKKKQKELQAEIQEGIQIWYRGKMKPSERSMHETDGLGNYNLMDDANVPSLLSLPWLAYCEKTIRFIKIQEPLY